MELTSKSYSQLYDSEDSIIDSLGKIKNNLEELLNIDKSFSDSVNECESAIALIADIAEFIRNYNSKIDIEPQRLEQIRERLSAINLLKKKFGGSINSIIRHRKKIGDEFDLAENFSEKITSLEKQINLLRISSGDSAAILSKKRIEVSKKISKQVQDILSNLGIANSKFEVRIIQSKAERKNENFVLYKNEAYKFNSNGIDEVEFYISTNIGEDLKPLSKVASGGEISRIMLALKTILANNDKLPLLIFDEIDTGVSGRVAQKVGNALKSLAMYHQIISITHLPQIAGMGDLHFTVEKVELKNRVVSSIKMLDETERIKEVAKLMSGEKITEASLNGAKELMGIKN